MNTCFAPSGARGARAFTLVELLVVLGVIAVLLSILLPVLSRARREARTTVCLNNARQIVAAVAAFSASNKGRLPANRTLTSETQHITWRARFAQDGTLPDGPGWRCPDQPDKPTGEIEYVDNGTTCVGDVAASYALNGHVVWRKDTLKQEADRTDNAVARPSHTIMLAESRAIFPDIRVLDFIVAHSDPVGGFFGFWHAGNGTYSFLDGHAQTINFMETGSRDCRWHNGRDFTTDPFDPQAQVEARVHDHPDWQYLVAPVYLNRRK
jgi:prepilin-type N-terminal cleavage/methylation domain-containing protein/prepilin-type processing-associated H-X9-DG protein